MGFPRMIVKCTYDKGVALTAREEYDVEYCTPTYCFVRNDNGDVQGFSFDRFIVIQHGVTRASDPEWEDERYTALTKELDGLATECQKMLDSLEAGTREPRNKYSREIKPGVFVDVYDVLRAFNVQDPCLQHLLKKALAAGCRGHKDTKEDLHDILASAQRAVEMYGTWNSD